MTNGGRKLTILGVVSVVIAFVTTTISLAIYHNSGDIYIDRSRPGFLPDKEEIKEKEESKQEEEYKFQEKGFLSKEDIDEYLEELQKEATEIDKQTNPFSDTAISDSILGIPEETN